jgi:hypothetical protein
MAGAAVDDVFVVIDHEISLRREASITGKLGELYLSCVFRGLGPTGGNAALDDSADQQAGN